MKKKDKTVNQKTPKIVPHRADHFVWRLDDVEILSTVETNLEQSAPPAIKKTSKRNSTHNSTKGSSSKT
jgi:hypothetical protein